MFEKPTAKAALKMSASVLMNARIWQGVARAPCSWLRVENGMIVALGKGMPEQAVKEGCELVDMKGRFVLPGLHDSHIHCKRSFLTHVTIAEGWRC